MAIQGWKSRLLTGFILCLLCVLSLRIGVHLRVRNVSVLQEKYLLEFDPYRYLRETKQIVENGNLPERDMMRYFPLGRELKEELSLNSYAIAYFFKLLRIFIPDISVEQATIYFPVICFVFGAVIFFLLVTKLLDRYTATLATTIFVVVPGILYRTSAGFTDRDALSLVEMLLAFYLYVKATHSIGTYKTILYSSLSGIATGSLGLTWPGVGLVMAVIVITNLILLIAEKYELKDAYTYLFWYIPVTIMLLAFTQRYIRLFDHLALLAFVPSGAFLIILALCLAIRRYPNWCRRLSFNDHIPLGMTISLIIFVFGTLFFSTDIIKVQEFLSFPLGNSRLMNSVSELEPFTINIWWNEYGLLLPFLLAGFVVSLRRIYSNYGFKIRNSLFFACILLLGTIFSTMSTNSILNGRSALSRLIYLVSLGLFVAGTLRYYFKYRKATDSTRRTPLDKTLVFMSVWFFVLFVATHGAQRFNMLFTPIAVIITVYGVRELIHYAVKGRLEIAHLLLFCIGVSVLCWLIYSAKDNIFNYILQTISFEKLSMGRIPWLSLNLSLLVIICFSIFGIIALRRLSTKTPLVVSWVVIMLVLMVIVGGIPSKVKGYINYPAPVLALDKEWQEALDWLRKETNPDSVIAAWWDRGHWIETVAERAAITDNDHYIPYWIHLIARHVLTAQSESEALVCLKTYGATHLLISAQSVIWHYKAISSIGSDENGDRVGFLQMFVPTDKEKSNSETNKEIPIGKLMEYTNLIPFQDRNPSTSIELDGKLYAPGKWHIIGMRITLSNNKQPQAIVRISARGNEFELPIREMDAYGKRYVNQAKNSISGIVVPITSTCETNCGGGQRVEMAFYLNEMAYNSLMVQLHLLNTFMNGFKLVYPSTEHPDSGIKIWEIIYPEGVKTNAAYLERDFPYPELYKPLSD